MKKIKPTQGNRTFCMAPWTHTYLSPQTERRMCCASREPAQSFRQYIDREGDLKDYNSQHGRYTFFLNGAIFGEIVAIRSSSTAGK